MTDINEGAAITVDMEWANRGAPKDAPYSRGIVDFTTSVAGLSVYLKQCLAVGLGEFPG
jgi:hypothetical protein